LGEKQTCPSCGAKFYDLRKRPAVCPKCQTAFDPADETLKVKRTRRAPVYGKAGYEDDEEAVAETEEAEEEVEETPELDAEGADEVIASEDDEDAAPEGDLPPGFSEADSDLEDETVAEDEIPTLEDEEEFSEDELGDISDAGDDEN
jgi:uncharacterized protein (TIGR02300 family)